MTRVAALCGGVGGAKLALGLSRLVDPQHLTIIVNTGDDFEHLGLHISPDIDTVLYTLSGEADPDRGWGRAGETWSFMNAVRQLGGDDWFLLGDRDLAMHVTRTRHLACGGSLSEFVARAARALGVGCRVLPMTDQPVRTVLETDAGVLPFQRYFVEQRAEPVIRSIRFDGASMAVSAPGVLEALTDEWLEAIVICPSNPYLSIDPILAVPGVRRALAVAKAPVIAVSPLIGGHAIKGPTAKIMGELGRDPSPRGLAEHYDGLLEGLIIDTVDSAWSPSVGLPVMATGTLMRTLADKERLAADVVRFARGLRRTPVASRRA